MARIYHGMSKTLTYDIWTQMRMRCSNVNNKDYPNYGGRGITVCQRWQRFDLFFADMGECPTGYSIDREDVNGDYEPSNCRWIPMREQSATKRDSQRVRAAVPDVLRLRAAGMSQEAIATEVGIDQTTVSRLLAANGLKSRITTGRSWRSA